MAAPDLDVIKDIPGYKVILKAILKSQIQQLVEQLASHTDEESVILTASVSDGTLSHLGSDSGKFFLEDHDDIKSQFLGFCLKRFHKKKEQEKERQERERQEKARQEAMRNMPRTPTRFGHPGPRPGFMPRSPRFMSPRQGLHPVALTRASPIRGPIRSPGNTRPSPYPMVRPRHRPPLNFDPQNMHGRGEGAMKLPIGGKIDGQVIKIEADDPDEGSNQSNADSNSQGATAVGADDSTGNFPPPSSNSSQPSSPSQTPHAAKVKSEHHSETDKDDDAKSDTSSSTIPNEASDLNLKFSDTTPPEGLSLESDLSNLISGDQSTSAANIDSLQQQQQTEGDDSPAADGEGSEPVNVKVEAITESEMELEITGVELGHTSMNPLTSPEAGWPGGANAAAMGYDPMAAMGSQESEEGYNLSQWMDGESYTQSDVNHQHHLCSDCGKSYKSHQGLAKHIHKVHLGGIGRHQCNQCEASFTERHQLIAHAVKHGGAKYTCGQCDGTFTTNFALKRHLNAAHNKVGYVCDVCGSVFMDKDVLSDHCKAKHEQMFRYVCKVASCRKMFCWRSSLARHVDKKHNNVVL